MTEKEFPQGFAILINEFRDQKADEQDDDDDYFDEDDDDPFGDDDMNLLLIEDASTKKRELNNHIYVLFQVNDKGYVKVVREGKLKMHYALTDSAGGIFHRISPIRIPHWT